MARLPTGGSGDLHYTFTQGSAAATWTITHNLGKNPDVSIQDSANDDVEADIKYLDPNKLELKFSSATAGKAWLN